MIYLKNLENEDYLSRYKINLENRGSDSSQLDKVLELNKTRKEFTHAIDTKKNEQKKMSEAREKMSFHGQIKLNSIRMTSQDLEKVLWDPMKELS